MKAGFYILIFILAVYMAAATIEIHDVDLQETTLQSMKDH